MYDEINSKTFDLIKERGDKMLEKPERIAKIFKALCDENRVLIVQHLQSGEKCACNIADELGLSQSKLSYHMKILCESGIVECWYVGKWTHYRICKSGSEHVAAVFSELTTASEVQEDCTCDA